MLEVMAGPHPLDHTTLEAWPAPYLRRLHEGIAGRRIAFSADLGHARVDPEVAELVRERRRAVRRRRRGTAGGGDAALGAGRARTSRASSGRRT